MSIRSYIAMAYALSAALVFGLAEPGNVVKADKLSCARDHAAAAVNAHISGNHAEIEVDENWLGWLMWEPAVYHAPHLGTPETTILISCGAGDPRNGPLRVTQDIAAVGEMRTIVVPVIDTGLSPAATMLLDGAAGAGEESDLPAYLSRRPGTPEPEQEPLWLVIDTTGHDVEIWSDTHAIDVTAVSDARIVTLAPGADLARATFVLHYRLSPKAPRIAAKSAQGA